MRRATSAGLPPRLTTLVGRDEEVGPLVDAVRTHALVTLTGPGGVGKTRLAVEVASRLGDELADGAGFVDLSGAEDPALVATEVATALGIDGDPHMPVAECLATALGPACMVLVLDNCEHLVAAVSELARDLVGSCAGLRVLATSRQALHVPGQLVWTVEPLGLPPPGGALDPSELAAAPAMRLFIDRARAVRRDFLLDSGNAEVVAGICRRVDGLPLAIELAASWVRALSPSEIEERLENDFGLLRARPGAPGRHETLGVVLDWSYRLLDPDERAVFDRLGAFAGGFTVEAAEAVCAGLRSRSAATAVHADEVDVVDVLARLVDKSLIVATEIGGRIRYRRLATTRAYAASHLAALPDAGEVRGRHARWFLELAERRLATGAPSDRRSLDIEHDNFASALGWAVAADPELGLRLFVALRFFWESGARTPEGRRWAEAALEAAVPASGGTILRARAADSAAALAMAQGDYGATQTWLEEALAIFASHGDSAGGGRVLVGLGVLARYRGELDRAEELLSQALGSLEGPGAGPDHVTCLVELGQVAALRGREPEAEKALREALARSREVGDVTAAAEALSHLGKLAAVRGEVATARGYHEQALGLRREADHARGVARSLAYLGELAWRQDDFDTARSLYGEALGIQRRAGDQRGMAMSLTNLAYVANQVGRHREAGQTYREVLELRRRLGDPRGEAIALVGLATALWLDDPAPADLDEARSLVGQAVVLHRQTGNRRGLAWGLYCQAEISRDRGDHSTAEAAATESLEIYRSIGEPVLTNFAIYTLASLATEFAQLERARALLAECTGLALAMGRRLQELRCVELGARVACAGGEHERAARLYGAAQAGRALIDQGPPRPALRAIAAADLDRLSAALGPAALAASWEEGRRLSIDQACAAVLGAKLGADDAPDGQAETPKLAAPWRVRLLGDVVVEAHGRPFEIRGRAPGQVMKMAALRGPVPVDEVVDILWPDAGPGVGRRRLNNVLARLRRDCGDLVVRQEDALRLAPGTDLDVTVFAERADAALAAARSGKPEAGAMCRDAVVLYQGELLPADRYEDWTATLRVRLARLYLDLLDALAEDATTAGRPGEAVEWLERAIEAEPLDESRYRRAAAIMVHQGWRHRALALALRARRMGDELGITLSPDLVALLPDH